MSHLPYIHCSVLVHTSRVPFMIITPMSQMTFTWKQKFFFFLSAVPAILEQSQFVLSCLFEAEKSANTSGMHCYSLSSIIINPLYPHVSPGLPQPALCNVPVHLHLAKRESGRGREGERDRERERLGLVSGFSISCIFKHSLQVVYL